MRRPQGASPGRSRRVVPACSLRETPRCLSSGSTNRTHPQSYVLDARRIGYHNRKEKIILFIKKVKVLIRGVYTYGGGVPTTNG
jgi:hypothetical protein